MSDKQEASLPCSNYVTRKLISGPNGSFIERLKKDFGVDIIAKISNTPVIHVKGAKKNVAAVTRVIEILQLLDQRASVLENQYNIQNTKSVSKEHWDHLRVDLYALLENKTGQKPEKLPPISASSLPLTDTSVNDNKSEKTISEKEKTKTRKRQPIQFISDFEPRNLRQAILHAACTETTELRDGSRALVNSYVYAAGPFGGGKTFSPLRAAFEVYSQGLVDEIICIRPSTTSSKNNPGAMPGNPRAKIDPYVKGGIGSNIPKIVKSTMQDLEAKKVMLVLTPEFERGESYDHAFILVDEPQNLTIEQAELLIGRLGEGSIMVFAGDIGGNQNDIRGQMPGLAHLIATQGSATKTNPILSAKTAFIKFTDEDSAARNGILPHVSHALRNPPDDYAEFLKVIQETRQDAKLAQAIDNARKFGEQTLTDIAEKTFKRYEKTIRAEYPSLFRPDVGNVTVLRPTKPQIA